MFVLPFSYVATLPRDSIGSGAPIQPFATCSHASFQREVALADPERAALSWNMEDAFPHRPATEGAGANDSSRV